MSILSDGQKQELAFPFHSLIESRVAWQANNELELINRAEKAVLLAVAENIEQGTLDENITLKGKPATDDKMYNIVCYKLAKAIREMAGGE